MFEVQFQLTDAQIAGGLGTANVVDDDAQPAEVVASATTVSAGSSNVSK